MRYGFSEILVILLTWEACWPESLLPLYPSYSQLKKYYKFQFVFFNQRIKNGIFSEVIEWPVPLHPSPQIAVQTLNKRFRDDPRYIYTSLWDWGWNWYLEGHSLDSTPNDQWVKWSSLKHPPGEEDLEAREAPHADYCDWLIVHRNHIGTCTPYIDMSDVIGPLDVRDWDPETTFPRKV